jgi:hypothetical protein
MEAFWYGLQDVRLNVSSMGASIAMELHENWPTNRRHVFSPIPVSVSDFKGLVCFRMKLCYIILLQCDAML